MLNETDFRKRVSKLQCLMLDMDGTIYAGDEIFPFTKDFLNGLRDHNVMVKFLTNNSCRSRKDYVEKLARMDLVVDENEIYTSGNATIDYLNSHSTHKRIFLMGTPSLEQEFRQAGFDLVTNKDDAVDCVVMGYDRTMTFEKLNNAYHLLANGAPFFATHPDTLCPIAGGKFDIDLGAMMQSLIYATGVEPTIIGKPHPPISNALLSKLNLPKEALAIMGDRLYTDIKTGLNNDFMSLLVLTGEATRDDIQTSGITPSFVLERNIDLLDYL